MRLWYIKKTKCTNIEVKLYFLAIDLDTIAGIKYLACWPVIREAIGKVLAMLCEDFRVTIKPMISTFISSKPDNYITGHSIIDLDRNFGCFRAL